MTRRARAVDYLVFSLILTLALACSTASQTSTISTYIHTINTESSYDRIGNNLSVPINFTITKLTKFGAQLLQPAERIRLADGPTRAPVAGTSLLWVSNTDDDPFLGATGAFYYFLTTRWLSIPSLRSRALTSLQLLKTPTTAPSGEVPLCMVHKVAQEASRRITPARALAHAVAPPLDRTSRSLAATVETAFVTSI